MGSIKFKNGLGAALLCAIASFAGAPVPRNGIFETALVNTNAYTNKFRDVDLTATFTAPSGRQTVFPGFFDGDGTGGLPRLDVMNHWQADSGGEMSGTVWKLRFMPTETGLWFYDWSFSDGSLSGSGRFECVEAGASPGVLRVDPDYPRWVCNDEGRFYPTTIEMHWGEQLAYPIEAYHQQYDLYLDKGFNMVGFLWLPIWDFTTWQVNPLNSGGESDPWITLWYQSKNHVDKDSSAYDTDRMLLFTWHRLEQHLRYLADHHVYAFPFQGFNVKHPEMAEVVPHLFPPDKYDWYMRYCMARLAPFYNLIWNNTWESDNGLEGFLNGVDAYDLWRRLRTRVESHGDPRLDIDDGDFAPEQVPVRGDRPFWVIENNDSTGLWGDDGEMCGGTERLADQKTVADLSWRYIVRSVPAFILELQYSGYKHPERHIAPLWETYAKSAGLGYYLIAHNYMRENTPFWRMSNADSLVSGGTVYCLAEAGKEYIVYRKENGESVLDLTAASGRFNVIRLNPFTGETRVGGSVSGRGPVTLVAADDFLVLHLKQEGVAQQP